MNTHFPKVVALLLCLCMVLSMVPMTVFAAGIDYVEREDTYYKVISKDDYQLAPGIVESEIVLNNDEGSHRQVAHVVEVDINNPYTKVMPSYKGMLQGLQNKEYGVQIMSQQAKWAEANGYGNVVAAMNLSLSWYDSAYYLAHPELVGEPLGLLVMDGEVFVNSNGQSGGAQTCLVINFDEKDGEARPADMSKTEIRATSSPITGWEEQVIPANFGFLVKDGVNQYSKNHTSDPASRSFVGIKEDGTIVMVMNDGRQSPYSAGFNSYEMAEFMLSLGCVQAVNGDGGGSSTFLSQRPGEELKLNCSPSDGAERPTTHGILVISTAPATGEFVRAQITTDADYYTPGSTVTFNALGTDLVGTAAEIPEDATWQLADDSMGTIENGVFVSNGKVGTVTAQMVWNGEVVGEGSIEIVIPETLSFAQGIMTVPFDKEVTIGLIATTNDGRNEVVLKASDITLTTTNSALGVFDGLKFTSVSEENAPADLSSTLTATLNHGEGLTATATLTLGKGSEVLFDFENGTSNWVAGEVNGNDDYAWTLTQGTNAHDGEGSLKFYFDSLASKVDAGSYRQYDLFPAENTIVENAKSIGFWVYYPEDMYNLWIRIFFWTKDASGNFTKQNNVTVIKNGDVYNTTEGDGWHYVSIDVSAYDAVMIPGANNAPGTEPGTKACNTKCRFIEMLFCHTNTNDIYKDNQTIGKYTMYFDNVTVDYSDAVDDREAPIFGAVNLVQNEVETALTKNNTVTTGSNVLNVSTTVKENTTKTNATGLDASSAKAYVDGVAVNFTLSNGRFSINDLAVSDGLHRVTFEISDMMGNKSTVTRLVMVNSNADTSSVTLVPDNSNLDSMGNLLTGSLYWLDLNASMIETIDSIALDIDINSTNSWELDHMELAAGFTADYVVDAETNTAKIIITRTGSNTETGAATIASLPVRILYYTDMNLNGLTPETYWTDGQFWPYELKVNVLKGEITYVDGYTADVLNAFSGAVDVNTEMYTAYSAIDQAYKASKDGLHVHTPVAVEDESADCFTAGFTGRTFCDGCNSVVDWGTVVPATGHSFDENVDGIHTCTDCGNVYYYVGGESQTGWAEVDGNVYYFNENGLAVNGEADVDGIVYNFADYVLTAPALVSDGIGLVGYWAGKQLEGGWHTIRGNKYYVTGIYVSTGITKIGLGTDIGMRYHIFDENGIFQSNFTGVIEYNGALHFAKNGACAVKGLQKDNDGNYYYINRKYLVITNTSYTLNDAMTGGQVPAGTYVFGADGKMVFVKNGLYFDDDGEIRYYKGDVAQYAGLVQDAEGNYYYINSSLKAVKNTTYYIYAARTNGLVKEGTYTFGADGKMLIQKNGVVLDADGEIRYYINDVAQYAGLVQDDAGNYYYINSSKKAVKNTTYYIYAGRTNGLMAEGSYSFDAQGKMILPKNGLVKDADGEIRYYVNDVATYAGLVQDADGNYYYINSSLKAIKNTSYYIYAGRTNGLMAEGTYKFGADGKMILPKEGLVIDSDGEIRFYKNEVAIYAGLVQDAEGNYYYINSSLKAIKSTSYYIYAGRTNGLLPEGTYTFGADGKMIVK